MTDETKRIFDAPWEVCLEKRGSFYRPCICSSDTKIASVCTKENANRFVRLPELYDKLMWAVVQHCPDAFLALDECRLCPDKKCKYREIVELLRKVRDGK